MWGLCLRFIYSLLVLVSLLQRNVIVHLWAFIASFPSGYLLPKPVYSGVVDLQFAMPNRPRLRGISRRGSHSGTRGYSSHPIPEVVEPLTAAPPSPRPLNLQNTISMNSQQSSRFVFQSSLNKPLVIVNFTISVSEEPSITQNPSPPPPTVTEDANVLLGDMTGVVFHADHMQEDPEPIVQPAPEPIVQQAPEPIVQQPIENVIQQADNPAPRETAARKPVRIYSGRQHLVTHPDGSRVFHEDGMITWLPSPSPEGDDTPASPKHTG